MRGSPMRPAVLVVEDDLATRTLLRVVLNRSGFEVDQVSSGTDVLTLLSAVPYSALLFDLYMRETSGHELLATLFTTKPEVLARVVVVSAAPLQELENVSELYPMLRVLRKPFELAELIGAVEAAAAAAEQPMRDLAAEFCRRSILNGAKAGIVRIPARDAPHLNIAMSYGYTAAMLDSYVTLAIDAPLPICAAYRRQRPVWFASLTVASAEYPMLKPVWEANQSHALAALPLIDDGKCVGVAAWSFREARTFTADERKRFEEIAEFLASEIAALSSMAKTG
jgi:CheY-like chemotaxis protein